MFHKKLKSAWTYTIQFKQAEIIEIYSLYSADLKKELGAYSGLNDIFVNFKGVHFFLQAF